MTLKRSFQTTLVAGLAISGIGVGQSALAQPPVQEPTPGQNIAQEKPKDIYETARLNPKLKTFVSLVDAAGLADNGRAVITLADNRVLAVGGGRPVPATPPAMGTQPPSEGMVGVLGPDGQPDESFGPGGKKLYDLGGATDFFWNVALSPSKKQVAAVGIAGGAAAADDEDGALLLLTLP